MLCKKYLSAAAGCFLLSFLCLSARLVIPAGDPAASLSPTILRFHVLADTNSAKDQQMKLEVRSLLLDLIYAGMERDGTGDGKGEVEDFVMEHRGQLEQAAERYMAEQGRPSAAHIKLSLTYFPEKSYGDVTLPAGYYEAVQVTLGQGRGRNWWCVLYPSLCMAGDTCPQMPASSLQALEDRLPADLYQSIIRPRLKIMELLPLPPQENGEPVV